MGEVCHLHERLVSNLRLAMSVFLDGHVRDARKLLEEKARFRDLQHEYAASHIARLQDNTPQSIETSSLHLDLISDLKRINSHICSIAYPILESAGALTATRIRASVLTPTESDLQKLGMRRSAWPAGRRCVPPGRACLISMTLSWPVVLAVLFGAVLHAGWNALVKSSGDKELDTALVHFLGALVALPPLLLVGPPPSAAWPFIGASLVVHIAYYVTLAGAYKHGELGMTYPIMRGSAPLLVALGSRSCSANRCRCWPGPA